MTGAIRSAAAALALGAALAAPAAAQQVAGAPGAVVRWLDKVSGQTVDLELHRGAAQRQGRLTLTMTDCRYPVADPASNAFAHLTIRDDLQNSGPIFDGWMIADSPALSALDNARYDVWLLRCTTS